MSKSIQVVLQQVPEQQHGRGEFRIQELSDVLEIDVSSLDDVVATIRKLGDTLTREQVRNLLAASVYDVTFRAI